jgi:hypothetical protein
MVANGLNVSALGILLVLSADLLSVMGVFVPSLESSMTTWSFMELLTSAALSLMIERDFTFSSKF